MMLYCLFVTFLLLACLCGAVNAGGLRRSANITTSRDLQESQVCNIQIVDVQFDDGRGGDTEEYRCLVDGDWNGYNDGIDDFSYNIDLPTSFLRNNDDAIRGGNFFIAIQGGEVVNDGVNPPYVTVPDPNNGVSIIKGLRGRETRRLQQGGVRGVNSVLVVRVSSNRGNNVSPSANALAGSVFGRGSQALQHSMKSQYEDCSGKKLTFQPVTSRRYGKVVNGVLDVQINEQIDGVDVFKLTNAMNQAAIDAVGDSLSSRPRHVMYCVPYGTTFKGSRAWVAFAYVNGVSSYYNDKWCDRLSAQVHEVGHNLGMQHSNEDGGEYGDQSGMMGFSYPYRDGPLMCFNAFKHYKLGWYSGQTRTVTSDWTGNLAAFMDARKTSSPVILRIGGGDIYAQLNRAKGMNAGTREKANQVVLVKGTELRLHSDVLAGLSSGGTFNLGNGQTIEVCEINFSGSVDYARVSIHRTGSTSGCRSTYSNPSSCVDDMNVFFVVSGFVRKCNYVLSRATYFRLRGQYWENYSSFCSVAAREHCPSSCQTCP